MTLSRILTVLRTKLQSLWIKWRIRRGKQKYGRQQEHTYDDGLITRETSAHALLRHKISVKAKVIKKDGRIINLGVVATTDKGNVHHGSRPS